MIKKILKWVLIVLVIIFILSIFFGREKKPEPQQESEPEAGEWANIRAKDRAHFAEEGWSTPVYLEINAYNGWIDSLEVSPDGKTIRYVFYPGPDLISDSATGNFKGDADIYMSEEPFKTHKPVGKYFMNEFPWSACCIHVDADGNFWYNTNYAARPGGSSEGNTDYHPLFRNDQLLALNDKEKKYGDVFYCKAQDELWLVGNENQLHVLKNAAADGFTSKPVKAPDPVSQGGQPFLPTGCNDLYFTANFGDVDSQGPAIYKSMRSGASWSKPVPLLWSKIGVGEFTFTADGKKAFFVQLFKNDKGEMRIGAFSTERK